MEGRPVWLASVATRDRDGAIVPTGTLSRSMLRENEQLLLRLLGAAGDSSREVLFRMNVTLCLHRGLTDDEEASLPAYFADAEPVDTAGTSVEVLRVRGVTGDAHRPCERPGRSLLPGATNPDLWLPEPCGSCAPCLARDAVRAAR